MGEMGEMCAQPKSVPYLRSMVKLLIADDHQIVIDGVKLMLRNQKAIRVVGEAHNGYQLLDILTQNGDVDMVLLDINMPKMSGIDCCRRITRNFPDISVVALTMLGEYSMIRDMLEAGAKGYLLKNSGHRELLDCIQAVSNGGTYYHPEVAKTILDGKPDERYKTTEVVLTRRELQVLRLIIDEHTTADIAEELNIGFGTVETHRRNIIQKLGVKNTAGMVRVALEKGLV